jgi:O-antigen/teichoic acid export membrane protein
MDSDLKSSSSSIAERTSARRLAIRYAQKAFAASADTGMNPIEKGGSVWRSFRRVAFGTHALALADQAVVSCTSFLTTVLIGRWSNASELGIYAIAISFLVSSTTIQDSLITTPYTIYQHHPQQTAPAAHAGSSLAHSALLSVLAMVALAVAAASLSANSALPQLVAVAWALAGVVPFVLLREFGRRFAFARLRMAESLLLDLAVAAIQLAGLGLLAWTGHLSATTACVAIGVACGLAGVVWLYLARRNFALRGGDVRATMKQNWHLGKWLFACQVNLLVHGYITYWLLAWVAGPAATGVYAACMSVVLFANPFITGLGNIFTPRAVLALAQGGRARLRRETFLNALLIGAAMTLFCALVLLAGEDVMRLLYPAKAYEGHGHTVTVLALALLAASISNPASAALISIERPSAIFWAGLFATVVTVCLTWWLVVRWGLVGGAYGFLTGNIIGSAGRWIAFAALVPRSGPKGDPMRQGAESKSDAMLGKLNTERDLFGEGV